MTMSNHRTKILDRVYSAKTVEELEAGYDDWAKTYDDDLQRFGYRLPAIVTGLGGRYVSRDAGPLLDAGCGTGLIGDALHLLGYKHLVGIDMSTGMLRVARDKRAYRELRRMILGSPLDFEDNNFAATFAVGVITVGHAPADAFDELIRITRSGGYLIFSIRVDREPETGYLDKLDALEQQHRWHRREMTAPFQSLPLAEPEVSHRVCVYQAS
jgi:predicted TPR repeat methyltransferase